MTAEQIAKLIHGTRFRFVDERELQLSIEALLKTHQVEFQREYILSPRDRIDFLCGSIGIEVKTDGTTSAVQRQLWRYASDDRISHLILVTSRAKHKSIADEILGKPVFITHLLNSIF